VHLVLPGLIDLANAIIDRDHYLRRTTPTLSGVLRGRRRRACDRIVRLRRILNREDCAGNEFGGLATT
jgi:hypothetical protein